MERDANEQSAHAEWVRAAVERYGRPLTRYALLVTGQLESACDVVQDTFVRLCAERSSDIEPRLAAWLFTVCRHRALDVRRKEHRMEPLDAKESNGWASLEPSPAARAEQREITGEVLKILERLPKSQQEVVRLRFQNGLSYREISRITDLTVSNVGFLIHTAIKTIRLKMEPDCNLAKNSTRRAL